MPRKPHQAPIVCQHFTWRLFQRDGVFYADGRTGSRNLGKHSLGTRDREQALANLRQLDFQKAIELGLIEADSQTVPSAPSIADGWRLYLDHCARPQVMGGASEATRKRYRAVRDKHIGFCQRRADSWSQIDKAAVQAYGAGWPRRTTNTEAFFSK